MMLIQLSIFRIITDSSHLRIGKDIPSDLIEANCVPPGFMVPTGWAIVCDYYQHVESDKWVPFSVMNIDPFVATNTKYEGEALRLRVFVVLSV